MSQAPAAIVKIPTENPQPVSKRLSAQAKTGPQQAHLTLILGGGESTSGEAITLDCGIKVYPPKADSRRWRAVWYENGRREQCEAVSEEKLAAKLEPVKLRLVADGPTAKIPTEIPQPSRAKPPARPRRQAKPSTPSAPRIAADREVITLDGGIKVYPPKEETGRWRAVWYEDGRREQCEAVSEEKLTAKLEKVKVRLEADAPKMRQPGSALIAHYLDPDRLPAEKRWSRKHAHTQMRLCQRFAAPVIDAVTCQDIKVSHMQKIVNAAPTAGEGDRVRGMVSAIVTAGVDAGYLVNSRLAKVHWQAAGRDLPAPVVSTAGESFLWVDLTEIPSSGDVARLGRALAAGIRGDRCRQRLKTDPLATSES